MVYLKSKNINITTDTPKKQISITHNFQDIDPFFKSQTIHPNNLDSNEQKKKKRNQRGKYTQGSQHVAIIICSSHVPT